MQGKYEENPIYTLYNILLDTFVKFPHINNGYELDPLLKIILLNNGCKISENEPQWQYVYDVTDDYKVYFITGMIGNDANEYYDFLIFNGMKVLVIFKDYFNFIRDEDINEEDPMYQLKLTMGNSIYYDALKRIVEVFYLTSEPMPGGLLKTSMHTTQRWNQSIIAIHILNNFKAVDENDVSDIPMEDVSKILNGNIKLQLYGIRITD